MDNRIQINDQETNSTITITNPNFYGPAISTQDDAYVDTSCSIQIDQTNPENIAFSYPKRPTEDYQLAMWDTLDKFEQTAWQAKNVGIKTGFNCIDKAFDGGLFPGFIIIGGDSNLGKTGFITQLAWQITQNNNDVYVMDFSLDDAMPDKLSRVAACSSRVIINAVKTPLNYMQYPLMLIRRKQAMLKIRANSDKYCAYDSTFSSFIEDIEEEVKRMLVYFDANGIDKKIVVCIDNFHDLNIMSQPRLQDKEKYDFLAQWCSDLAKNHNITVICTAELKKLNGNRRPILDDIREAVKIKYEAKAILLVYNEVHYKGDGADIFFMKQGVPFKQPVFEVHFAKNKFGTYKGRAFFEFYPEMAYMQECDPNAQKTYSQIIFG